MVRPLATLCIVLAAARTVGVPLVGMAGDMCLHTADRATCNSHICPGYSWCELCTKCLYTEHAVTGKDEL